MHRSITALALLGTLALPLSAQRSTENSFTWQGRMSAGSTLQIHNINGRVTVERASGDNAEVVTKKTWTRGDPAAVVVEAVRFGTGNQSAAVCAMWNATSRCTENGAENSGRSQTNEGDVAVEFTIRLPAGVNARLNTVNGTITVTGASAEVSANTVNGDISINNGAASTRAKTVTGDIRASVGASGSESLEYSTVNGSITLALPANLNANVQASTVNGSINPQFSGGEPIRATRGRGSYQATLGNGGRQLRATTVNGSITLTRG